MENLPAQPANGSTPPPCCRQGTKNGHSPWSAPRERKRRSKAVQPGPAAAPAPAVLSSIEELECTTSPPKRHHGDQNPAPRGLGLVTNQALPCPTAPDVHGAPGGSGPLAQGLLAAPSAADAHFSPLASGLRAPSFTAGSTFGFQNHFQQQQQQKQQQPPHWQVGATAAANAEKQRKQPRQATTFRNAAARQQGAAGPSSSLSRPAAAAASGPAPAASDAGADLPLPTFCAQLWQAAVPAPSQPFSLLPQHKQEALASASMVPGAAAIMQQGQESADAAPPTALCTVAANHLPSLLQGQGQVPPPPLQQQQLQPGAPLAAALAHAPFQEPQQQQQLQPVVRTAARCSTGQDMETDLRSSWGSERSADVSSWQALQARLREELATGAETPCGTIRLADQGAAAALQRHAGLATDDEAGGGGGCGAAPCAVLQASVDCEAASLQSSMEAPSCTDRQASMRPLRASLRGAQWQSHLPSPPGDGASTDPLLGPHQGPTSSGNAQHRSGGRGGGSGNHMKWGCFSCASPFSCRQPGAAGDDSDEEVVRRNDSTEGFVIRRQQSFPPPSPEPTSVERSSGGPASGRLKRAGLNHPPDGGPAELVHRQAAFSARCSTTPGDHSAGATVGAPCSPYSEAGSDDSFSLPSGPGGQRSLSLSVGLRDASIEELAEGLAGDSEGAPASTVDALNDMLKALSLCPEAHPKDAEALVAQACQNHSIQPNATTARTLEKMWAVHEQLYG